MRLRILGVFVVAFLALLPPLAGADNEWILERSTLTWHTSHPLHQSEGVSHAARGKGICRAGQCEFLIAVPVKSFDSGDTNRDLHMLQVTRGAEFPMVVVTTRLSEDALSSTSIHADLKVQFAGQTAEYKQVSFQLSVHGNEALLSGSIPATLSDFKINPPTLLMIPIKNEMPVHVETSWQRVSGGGVH